MSPATHTREAGERCHAHVLRQVGEGYHAKWTRWTSTPRRATRVAWVTTSVHQPQAHSAGRGTPCQHGGPSHRQLSMPRGHRGGQGCACLSVVHFKTNNTMHKRQAGTALLVCCACVVGFDARLLYLCVSVRAPARTSEQAHLIPSRHSLARGPDVHLRSAEAVSPRSARHHKLSYVLPKLSCVSCVPLCRLWRYIRAPEATQKGIESLLSPAGDRFKGSLDVAL